MEDILDRIRRFSSAKLENFDCKICGSNTWGLLPPEDVLGRLPVGPEEGKSFTLSAAKTFAIIPLFCLNCGDVRFIAKQVLDQWIAEQGGEATSSS